MLDAVEMPRGIKVSPFVKQCFVTCAVAINIVGHGCAHGFPATLLPQLREPGSGFQLTKEEESWIASLTALFILVGNLISSPIMDRLGRKTAHYAATVPSFAGWIIIVLAADVKHIMFARAILGMACGQLNSLRSVLIGEYTSPRNRGAFLTVVSLAQAIGIFLVHLLGSFFSWQLTALICSFFSFTSLLMIIYTPESPSWLAGRGRYQECSEVFRWLRGEEEDDELTELIKARMDLAKDNFVSSKTNSNRLRIALNTLMKQEFYKPIVLMIHAFILMQFSGGAILSVYSIVILNALLGPTAKVYFWMVFLDTLRIFTNTATVYIIKKTKRRTMIFVNGGICVISYLATALYMFAKTQGWISVKGVWLPAILVSIHMFTVGLAMVPMPNVIAGEVFPLEYRGIGGTICMACSSITVFVVLKTFPGLMDMMALQGTYLLYSVVLTYCLLVLWVLLPETKDRTLQQIEDEWRGRSVKSNETEAQQPLHELKSLSSVGK